MGKKRDWKKISTVATEEALEESRIAKDVEAKELADELFSFDIEGAGAPAEKRARRGQVSFKKKAFAEPSEAEHYRIDKAGRRLKNAQPKPAPAPAAGEFDIWTVEEKPRVDGRTISSDSRVRMSAVAKPHIIPESVNKLTTDAPVIIHAHSGQSMNPKREKYEELAAMATAREYLKKEEEDKYNRLQRPMTAELVDRLGVEVVKNMDESERMVAYFGTAVEEETPVEPVVKKKTERKTTAQRGKELRQKFLKTALAEEKKREKLEKSIDTAAQEMKQLIFEEKQKQLEKKYKEELKAQNDELVRKGLAVGKVKVGNRVFEDMDAEVALPKEGHEGEDMKSGMRQARLAMGGALRDRVASIYRRKMVAASTVATRENLFKAKDAALKRQKSKKYINSLVREIARENSKGK